MEKATREINERKVSIFALKQKYRDTSFATQAVEDKSINAFLTGQHIDPRIPETMGNLTRDEMTKKVLITSDEKYKEQWGKSKIERFPYIIDPEMLHAIQDKRILNCSTYVDDGSPVFPPDYVFYNWISNYIPEVAKSKDEVINTKHIVYLFDEEKEATSRISKRDKIYNAMQLYKSLASEELADIAL